MVASGFGARAQWYRNVLADPRVRAYVAGGNARPLTGEETSAVLGRLRGAAPARVGGDEPVLENTLGAPVAGMATAALDLGQRG